MELTRRDALYSILAGASAAAASTSVPPALLSGSAEAETPADAATVETLVGVAEVVYPSTVSDIPAFVRRRVSSLPNSEKQAVASAASELTSYAREVAGTPLIELPAQERDAVLRTMGVGRAVAARRGPIPARIRYFIVDRLLYWLYSSPKGSRLVGIDNPVGHPGGYESYQTPPEQPDGGARSSSASASES